jgi:hypothetical protein
MQKAQNLIHKWFLLSRLVHHEVPSTFLGDLDESITGHVLDTLVGLVHEFEELVDNRLQEFPVCLEESRILADNVHDIGSNNCFVVLSAFYLAESKQILDHGYQKPFLGLFVYRGMIRNGQEMT